MRIPSILSVFLIQALILVLPLYAQEGGETASVVAQPPVETESKALSPQEQDADQVGEEGLGKTSEEEVESEPLPDLVWFDGTVTRVRDADLIEIDGEKLRLLGVTGPRRWWWGVPRDCHAEESIAYLEGMIKDKEVRYAFDPVVGPDRRHGFRRVYVMVDEQLVNADLIEKGMALVDRSRHYLMRAKFEEFEAAAKLHMLGLWHRCPVECYRGGSVCRVKNW